MSNIERTDAEVLADQLRECETEAAAWVRRASEARSELETVRQQLRGAVDLADEFEMLADACGHCLAAGRPPNQQMIDNARAALAAFRGQ